MAFLNTGTLTLGLNTSDVLTFTGGLTATVPAVIVDGTISTAGQPIALGSVTLAGATTLDATDNGTDPAGAGISLGAVAGNGDNLTLDAGTSGAVTSASISGVDVVTLANAASFTFSGSVTATTLATFDEPYTVAFDGGGTLTDAVQFLNTGAVTLTGTMTFTGGLDTIDGASHPASTTLDGAVRTAGEPIALGSATLSGTTTLDTTNDGADPAGAEVSLGTVAGGGQTLDIEGNALFGGAVSNLNTLDVSGPAVINGGAVASTGTQTYHAGVTLGATTIVTASTATFDSTLDANGHALDIVGNAVFGGAVNNLTTLNVSGTAAINGGAVTSSGNQTYQGGVTLGVTTTLAAPTAIFAATLDGGANSLDIDGNAVFGGAADNLDTLNVSGSAAINGGAVASTGNQTYQSPVTLGTATSLTAATAIFDATLDGRGHALSIAGNAVFIGAVSNLDTLNVSGTAAINGGAGRLDRHADLPGRRDPGCRDDLHRLDGRLRCDPRRRRACAEYRRQRRLRRHHRQRRHAGTSAARRPSTAERLLRPAASCTRAKSR